MLKNLQELDLTIPENVVRAHIASYEVHSPFGVLHLRNPDEGAEILSVFRGGGPLRSSGQGINGLDGFLLGQAISRGSHVVRRRVKRVDVSHKPTLAFDKDAEGDGGGEESVEYDLVVLASGLNSGSAEIIGLNYVPPPTLTLTQDELRVRPEDIQEFFGNKVKVFLLPHTGLVFGSLVPKGDFINVSLMGRRGPPNVESFLSHDVVKAALPFRYERSCGCHPRIAVGPASGICGDGIVAVGDSAVTRLYKDGIGAALLTSRQAAYVATHHGTSKEAFAQHYAPFCDAMNHDNSLGKRIFDVHNRSKDSRTFFRANARLVESEQCTDGTDRVFSRILWGILTGNYTYREIWDMAKKANTAFRITRAYLRELGRRS